jgi:hypothetical protein
MIIDSAVSLSKRVVIFISVQQQPTMRLTLLGPANSRNSDLKVLGFTPGGESIVRHALNNATSLR